LVCGAAVSAAQGPQVSLATSAKSSAARKITELQPVGGNGAGVGTPAFNRQIIRATINLA